MTAPSNKSIKCQRCGREIEISKSYPYDTITCAVCMKELKQLKRDGRFENIVKGV